MKGSWQHSQSMNLVIELVIGTIWVVPLPGQFAHDQADKREQLLLALGHLPYDGLSSLNALPIWAYQQPILDEKAIQ
jgi:hypothetical protein